MKLFYSRVVITILVFAQIISCAKWESVPKTVDQHYGQAYHAMIENQALCPEQGEGVKETKLCPKHTNISAIDGQKAQGVINSYRQGSATAIENAKTGVVFDSKSVGGSGSGH